MKVVCGVLALQGDFAERIEVLQKLKVECHEVRTEEDLKPCTHLIIPGGESTVMSKLMHMSDLDGAIFDKADDGKLAVYGTCAGAILLARKVRGKNIPRTLGLINMTIERNAYGNQIDSFEASLKISGAKTPIKAAFIRAPLISKIHRKVEVLASYEDSPVLVKQGRILAGTFHPEARGETKVHELFLKM